MSGTGGIWQRTDTGTRFQFETTPSILLAVILPVLVVCIQWPFWSAIQPSVWFLFFPAVFFSVLIGRLWGGILATLVSTLLAWYFFIPPQFSFAISSPAVLISILAFAANGIGFSYFYEFLYRSSRRTAGEAAETRFQLLFEQATDGIVITGAGGRFIDANSCFCRMSGYSREALLAMHIGKLLPASDLARICERASTEPGLANPPSEWTLLLRDGSTIPVEVTAHQFTDGRWSAIIRDIRERHRSREQERAAEEKFHAFMDAIPAVAWIKDAAGNYVYLNRAWGDALDTQRELWIGKPTEALMPAEVAARLAANDALVRATGKAVESEEETVGGDGRRHLWRSIKFPIVTAGGPPLLGGVAMDVSAQRQSEAALQASAELNRAVLDSIRSQMAVLDCDGRIVAVNEAWRCFSRENCGAPEQELRKCVGVNFLEVCRRHTWDVQGCDETDGESICRAVLELLQGKRERFSCESRCSTEAGDLWFLLNVVPLRTPAGGAVVSYLDITENKQSQEIQQSATVQLKAMAAKHLSIQEEERRLLSMELHDHIGQTLTSLNLNLHALQDELPHNSRGQHILLEGVASIEELLGTTRDIARRLRPPALDDLGLASAVRWHINQIADTSNLRIDLQQNLNELRLAPALELACFRVLQEAVSNALRHSRAGKLCIALSLGIDSLHLSVRDDGIGFDVDETFRKLRNLASLGLIGMRERVTELGGRFHINSSPGSGTEIAATFPLPP